jgi:hypothetical protein
MDYRNHYALLIERARQRTLQGYSEKHHVLPRCMGGTNDACNLVGLTAREHFVAHKLLVKIYPESIKLKHALWAMMTANKKAQAYRITSRCYEMLRVAIAESMKGNTRGQANKGRPVPHMIGNTYGARLKGRPNPRVAACNKRRIGIPRPDVTARCKGVPRPDVSERNKGNTYGSATKGRPRLDLLGKKRPEHSAKLKGRPNPGVSRALKGRPNPAVSKSLHRRWHVKRGIMKDTCVYCQFEGAN